MMHVSIRHQIRWYFLWYNTEKEGEKVHIHLPLKEMSRAEKLATMESLWNSLCEEEDLILSPDWHEKVLKNREKETFTEWEQSKKEILHTINDH